MEHGSKLQLFGVILVREAFISYVSTENEIFTIEKFVWNKSWFNYFFIAT